MSAVDVTPGIDFSALQQSVNDICETVDHLREERATLKARVSELELALADMIDLVKDSHFDSEGRYPVADSGCIECTLGTVPNDRNTGLCAYHKAKELLA